VDLNRWMLCDPGLGESEESLRCIWRIKEQYLHCLLYGSRPMTGCLESQREEVNRKRVQ